MTPCIYPTFACISETIGLQTWEKQRARWVGNDLDDTATNTKPKVMRYARDIDVDGIIDHIFSNAWQQNQQQNCQQQLSARSPGKMFGVGKTSFAHPIPLCQIVDVLVDLWEAEGLEI